MLTAFAITAIMFFMICTLMSLGLVIVAVRRAHKLHGLAAPADAPRAPLDRETGSSVAAEPQRTAAIAEGSHSEKPEVLGASALNESGIAAAALPTEKAYPTRNAQLCFWEHLADMYDLSPSWQKSRAQVAPAALQLIETNLPAVLDAHGVVEAPVYAFLRQMDQMPRARIVGLNFAAGNRPAAFVALENGPLTDERMEGIKTEFRSLQGLAVSVHGEFMSPTLALLRSLVHSNVRWRWTRDVAEGEKVQELVQIRVHYSTSEQLDALRGGDVQLAQIVYPATDRVVAEHDDLVVVGSIERWRDHFEYHVASIIICDERLLSRGSATVESLLRLVIKRNGDLHDIQMEEPQADEIRRRETVGTMLRQDLAAALHFNFDFGQERQTQLAAQLVEQRGIVCAIDENLLPVVSVDQVRSRLAAVYL